jgi:type I restriction-modification system DNA methylase subunit/restriction endonuclease S subunit
MSKIPKQYVCDLCEKVFNQKGDFIRHKNKKMSCISLNELQQIVTTKQLKNDDKNKLVNLFKNCLNILRDNEGLTGEKALRNISYLLILKLIEPRLGNEIDIDNYNYDFTLYEFTDDMLQKHKNTLLSIARFSNLSNENEYNIPNLIKHLWEDILCVHPSTKNIFLKDKMFDIQRQTTYKKIIDKLNSFDFTQTEYDILGNAYEEVIQDIMTGKVLGQFFTQPLIKKMMVQLINPQIYNDGKIETCGDPTMGTGGFLITYLQYILKQAKNKNIKPDWNFIKTDGLYGKELEPDTYQLAVSNMLISSGHMFEYLERGDSIREPIIRKFDNILANPPFGIKGLKYDDFHSSLKFEYTPIKTDNAVSLFIQAIIYMLKINGKCAIVLPDGQDLFSKTNKTLIAVREYLLKTCELKEIIYLPSGIFNYTNIKTCVFYFVKKIEGKDILQTIIKYSKSNKNKETDREYKFSLTLQTYNVKFYDYNPYEDIKNLLVEVPIEKIVNNTYSLNYTEYIKDENKEEYDYNINIKTIGEICEFLPKSKRQASQGNNEGLYPFYTSSQYCNKFCNEYDYDDECLIIGTGGIANIKYSNKFSCSADNLILKTKECCLTKYIYYYLSINIDILQRGFVGSTLKHISKEYIQNIKIPIPSLQIQQQIVDYLDFIYEKANKTSLCKIEELKELNKYYLNNQKNYSRNINKTIGEICEFLPKSKRQASYGNNEGLYPFYTSSQYCNKFCNEYDYDDECLIIGTGGIANIKYSNKFSCSADNLILKTKECCLIKYIYYYLSINIDILQRGFVGSTLKHISKEYIQNIEIPIPSLQIQQQIVDYCDQNYKLIQQLQYEINRNKELSKQFMDEILKNKEIIEKIEENNREEEENEIIEISIKPKFKRIVKKQQNNNK